MIKSSLTCALVVAAIAFAVPGLRMRKRRKLQNRRRKARDQSRGEQTERDLDSPIHAVQ